MKRRNFIKSSALSIPLLSVFPAELSSMVREFRKGKLEKRKLGKTGEKLSIIGFGGIVVRDATTEQAAARVAEAIDFGVNYFDVAPAYGNAEEIHKNYDFTHCTCYWVAKDNNLVLPSKALESIITKELFYQGSLYPLCSIIRTRKFLKRGWHINAGQYLKMCFQLSQLDLTDVDVLQEQLTGVDAAYFVEVIDKCKEKKEQSPDFEITMPYLCKIVDRIFGGPGENND